MPDLSGKYIPELWHPTLLEKFYNLSTVWDISNTDYDGEIKDQGDTVHINQYPAVPTHAHSKGQKITYDMLETPDTIDLLIDKGRGYGFMVDRIDELQSKIEVQSKWAEAAGIQLKVDIDADVLTTMPSQASAYNVGNSAGKESGGFKLGVTGNPIGLTSQNILGYFADLQSVLNECNIPDDGNRWIVLPEWAANKLNKSDLIDASLTGDAKSVIRNGLMGEIYGFKVYKSNQVPKVTDTVPCYYIMAGHKKAHTFATQLTEYETFKHPDYYGTAVRGLMVYGTKVVQETALAVLYAKNAA